MTIIAGPCQHENLPDSYDIAEHCQSICNEFGINYIFKASFDKANRTYIDSPRGLGLKECKADFDALREVFKLTTDFHQTNQVEELEVDVVQIPALLCKQTDLLLSAKKLVVLLILRKVNLFLLEV